jgi:hypothetical protein
MKNKPDLTNKPYNRCLSCQHRGIACDGPRTAGLPLARWKEYMRDMKELNNLTNTDIADRTEGTDTPITVKTVERAISTSSPQDIMRDTARAIENAIIGSTSRYPCYLAYEEENAPTSRRAEIAAVREEAEVKIKFLLTQLEKLRADNDNLWSENMRKSKLIDHLLTQKGIMAE